jgi:hypothetical protein
LKDGVPTPAIGGKELKFKGVNQYGDSCELTINEYRDKSDLGNGEMVRYSLGMFYYNVGEKSGHVFVSDDDNEVDSPKFKADYDFSTGMDALIIVNQNGKVSTVTDPKTASAAGYFAWGDINSWDTAQSTPNQLVINQAAKRGFQGRRTFKLNLTPDNSSIASVTILSYETKAHLTCTMK